MHRAYQPPREPLKRRLRWWSLLPWLAAAYAATCFYTVRSNEQAVVSRCGKALGQLQPPGLHVGLPYGIDRVSRLKIREPKRVATGASLTERALGRKIEPIRTECLTGDRNLILVPAIVQYHIQDAKGYLFAAADVPALVRNVTAGALCSTISSMTVDDVLTVERREVQNRVMAAAQEVLDRYGAGVLITALSLEGMGPPQEVADAFGDVNSARWDRRRAENEADGYRKRIIPQARGEAKRIITDAKAFREDTVKTARGSADRFLAVAEKLPADQELTARRLILETMEEVLPRLNKIILDDRLDNVLDLGLIEEEP